MGGGLVTQLLGHLPRMDPPQTHPLCFPPAADCAGGQGPLPCGQPCPRSCEDLSPGVVCQPDSTGCQQPSCGCPPGQLSQDGLCVPPAQCRCQYQPGAMGQCPPTHPRAQQRPPAWRLPPCPWGPAWDCRTGMGNSRVPGLVPVGASVSSTHQDPCPRGWRQRARALSRGW